MKDSAVLRRRFARILGTDSSEISVTEAGGQTLFDFDYNSVRDGRVQSSAVYDPDMDAFTEMTVRFPPVDNEAVSGREATEARRTLRSELNDDIQWFDGASGAAQVGARVEIASTGLYAHVEVEDIDRESGFELLQACMRYDIPSWEDISVSEP